MSVSATTTLPGFELSRGAADQLVVSGVLSFETAAAALKAMQSATSDATVSELDLAGVRHCDSAGLACVLAVAADIDRRGGTLKVTNMPSGMQALARVCEVDGLMA